MTFGYFVKYVQRRIKIEITAAEIESKVRRRSERARINIENCEKICDCRGLMQSFGHEWTN